MHEDGGGGKNGLLCPFALRHWSTASTFEISVSKTSVNADTAVLFQRREEGKERAEEAWLRLVTFHVQQMQRRSKVGEWDVCPSSGGGRPEHTEGLRVQLPEEDRRVVWQNHPEMKEGQMDLGPVDSTWSTSPWPKMSFKLNIGEPLPPPLLLFSKTWTFFYFWPRDTFTYRKLKENPASTTFSWNLISEYWEHIFGSIHWSFNTKYSFRHGQVWPPIGESNVLQCQWQQ